MTMSAYVCVRAHVCMAMQSDRQVQTCVRMYQSMVEHMLVAYRTCMSLLECIWAEMC